MTLGKSLNFFMLHSFNLSNERLGKFLSSFAQKETNVFARTVSSQPELEDEL